MLSSMALIIVCIAFLVYLTCCELERSISFSTVFQNELESSGNSFSSWDGCLPSICSGRKFGPTTSYQLRKQFDRFLDVLVILHKDNINQDQPVETNKVVPTKLKQVQTRFVWTRFILVPSDDFFTSLDRLPFSQSGLTNFCLVWNNYFLFCLERPTFPSLDQLIFVQPIFFLSELIPGTPNIYFELDYKTLRKINKFFFISFLDTFTIDLDIINFENTF